MTRLGDLVEVDGFARYVADLLLQEEGLSVEMRAALENVVDVKEEK